MTSAEMVRDYLPWLMSAITLWMTFQQGKKRWTAWLWGLLNQLLWLAFIMSTKTWGLLPLNFGLWYLYIRNAVLWCDEEHASLLAQRRTADERWMKCDCRDLRGCVKCNTEQARP